VKGSLRSFKVGLLALATVVATAGSSQASLYPGSHFNGAETDVTGGSLAETKVEVESQDALVDPDGAVSAWTMLVDDTRNCYAQVGYAKGGTNYSGVPHGMTYFRENTDKTTTRGAVTQYFNTASPGGFNWYRVTDNGTDWVYYINDVQVGSTISEAAAGCSGFLANRAANDEEIHATGDRFPGSVSNPVSFSLAQIRFFGYNWQNAVFTRVSGSGDSNGKNNIKLNAGNSFDAWDARN
jgi:hypothetical protein